MHIPTEKHYVKKILSVVERNKRKYSLYHHELFFKSGLTDEKWQLTVQKEWMDKLIDNLGI